MLYSNFDHLVLYPTISDSFSELQKHKFMQQIAALERASDAEVSPANSIDPAHRAAWRAQRSAREAHLRGKPSTEWNVFWFRTLSCAAEQVIRATGLYRRGRENARRLDLSHVEFELAGLPPAFSGYEILHLSDFHFDTLDGLPDRIHALLDGRGFDLCVLNGDYSDHEATPLSETLGEIYSLCSGISARDGIYSVLGNHDSARLVEPLEEAGIRCLINESIKLARGGGVLTLTGTDDPTAFWSEGADRAFAESGHGCKLALVHSPELADIAHNHGYALYLSGHTHGGQVCLPGGRAMATGLSRHRKFYRGRWRYGSMEGYTNRGAGVSNIPIRFNSRGEAAVITLRASAS